MSIVEDFKNDPGIISQAGMAGGLAGDMYDAEVDTGVAGILAEYDANPEDMELAGEVANLYEMGAELVPYLSPTTAQRLGSAGGIANALMQEAARRQSEWGQFPNYPTTATLTASGAGSFDSDTITLRPLGSGTADEGRPLTLLSFLCFTTKANDTCELKITDVLKNGAPQLATVGGGSAGGGFFSERIRPVNLQGPHVRPIMVYGLNFKVGDTYAIRATASAAGTYFFELDFAVRPYAASDQRAPSMFGGGTAAALGRALGRRIANARPAPARRPAAAPFRPSSLNILSRIAPR